MKVKVGDMPTHSLAKVADLRVMFFWWRMVCLRRGFGLLGGGNLGLRVLHWCLVLLQTGTSSYLGKKISADALTFICWCGKMSMPYEKCGTQEERVHEYHFLVFIVSYQKN